MSVTSQFLSFYIDELLKIHWVDWSENFLSQKPDDIFVTKKGFQDISGGAESSTVRTRALECYRMGLINSKLVSSRAGGSSSIPGGWAAICEGKPIHSNIGYISYVIGKALRENRNDHETIESLNSLCSLLILNIGFQTQGRWYTTIFLIIYVKNVVEKEINRALSAEETRFLSGAVFNTLDFDSTDQLINSYKNNDEEFFLRFKYRVTDKEYKFIPKQFVEIYSDDSFDLNSTERHKASLFWASPDRGIYSRAMASKGSLFLKKLTAYDMELAQKGQNNFLKEIYDGLDSDDNSIDLLDFLLKEDFDSGIKKELYKIMKSLNDGVISALELIKNTTNIVTAKKFYVHDIVTISEDTKTLEIKIRKNEIGLIPEVGCTIQLDSGETFIIDDLEIDNIDVTMTLTREI